YAIDIGGRFPGYLTNSARKHFKLVLRAKKDSPKQGPLEYAKGVELEVVSDELGVFEDAKQLFFAVSESSRFMAHLVVILDSSHSPIGSPWGSAGFRLD